MRPDLYIAAMGRSGSTLVTNWLSHPGEQVLFYEPNLFARRISAKLALQCDGYGLEIGHGIHCNHPDMQAWLAGIFGDRLHGLKWGFKEILSSLHRQCLAELQPRFVLVVVRDIQAIYASFIEKHRIQRNEARYPPSWSYDYCMRESGAMVGLVQSLEQDNHPHLVVRYEDFIASPDARTAVESHTGWRGGGNLDRHLDLYQREFESVQHQGQLSSGLKSCKARKLEPVEWQAMQQLAERCSRYQSFFGFDMAEREGFEPSIRY